MPLLNAGSIYSTHSIEEKTHQVQRLDCWWTGHWVTHVQRESVRETLQHRSPAKANKVTKRQPCTTANNGRKSQMKMYSLIRSWMAQRSSNTISGHSARLRWLSHVGRGWLQPARLKRVASSVSHLLCIGILKGIREAPRSWRKQHCGRPWWVLSHSSKIWRTSALVRPEEVVIRGQHFPISVRSWQVWSLERGNIIFKARHGFCISQYGNKGCAKMTGSQNTGKT